VSLKNIFFKTKLTYKIYLYYNLYIRHKFFLNRKQYSQWGEDLYIYNFFKNKKKGIYLDIGCFHPCMYSNTYLLYKNGWSGINVDINQTSIDLFNIARPEDTNLCTTIDKNKKKFIMYYDDPFSPVNTLSKRFYKGLKDKFFKNKKKLSIKSKTIEEIIEIGKIEHKIDFINIDVEGLDYEVLKQIDINKLKVKLISIETHNVDLSASKNFNLISSFLKKKNFSIYKRIGPTTLYSSNS